MKLPGLCDSRPVFPPPPGLCCLVAGLLLACSSANSQPAPNTAELPLSINACFQKEDTNLVIILPTGEATKAVCERIAQYARRAFDKRAVFLEDTAALGKDLSRFRILTYGTLSGNLWVKQNLKGFPVVITRDKIVTDREFAGTHLRLISCWLNPCNPAKPWVIYTAQNAEDVAGINGVFHGWTQFHVARGTELLESGYYSHKNGVWTPSDKPDFVFPVLTREQMYQDYDKFVSIVEQVFPLTEVNRQIYGIDVRSLLATNRAQIAAFSRTEQFVDLINRTIVACRGSHFWVSVPRRGDYYKGFVDDSAYDLGEKYELYVKHGAKGNGLELPLLYFHGEYYTLHDFACDGVTCRKGLKVLKCNGKTPEAIVSGLTQSGVPLRWDYSLRHFYTPQLVQYASEPGQSGTNPVVLVQLQQTNGAIIKVELRAGKKPTWTTPRRSREPVVAVLNTNILYLRVPAMDPKLIGFYKERLQKLKGKPIQKVVIDIRDNGGGSDNVWQELLSLLVDRKIALSQALAVKKSDLNSRYLARHPFGRIINRSGKTEKIAFLNQEEFRVFRWSQPIAPAAASLKLRCRLFVLSDNIYSAAGSLMNICKGSDRLVSVGLPNSMILGCGIDPFAFSLPNSKLVFTLEPVVDLTDAKTARDTHHNDVEVEITPTLEQLLDYYNTGDDLDLEKRLNQHDPFFAKVLALDLS